MVTKIQLRPMLANIFHTTANGIGMKITMDEAWELVERLSDKEVYQICEEGYYYGKMDAEKRKSSHERRGH